MDGKQPQGCSVHRDRGDAEKERCGSEGDLDAGTQLGMGRRVR